MKGCDAIAAPCRGRSCRAVEIGAGKEPPPVICGEDWTWKPAADVVVTYYTRSRPRTDKLLLSLRCRCRGESWGRNRAASAILEVLGSWSRTPWCYGVVLRERSVRSEVDQHEWFLNCRGLWPTNGLMAFPDASMFSRYCGRSGRLGVRRCSDNDPRVILHTIHGTKTGRTVPR